MNTAIATLRNGIYRGAVVNCDDDMDFPEFLDALSEKFNGSLQDIEKHLMAIGHAKNLGDILADRNISIYAEPFQAKSVNIATSNRFHAHYADRQGVAANQLWIIEDSGLDLSDPEDKDMAAKWLDNPDTDESVFEWADEVAQGGLLSRDSKIVARFKATFTEV